MTETGENSSNPIDTRGSGGGSLFEEVSSTGSFFFAGVTKVMVSSCDTCSDVSASDVDLGVDEWSTKVLRSCLKEVSCMREVCKGLIGMAKESCNWAMIEW